jgi:hypothetical protein
MANSTPYRRILLAGLSDADARRLAVFLALRSERLRQEWRVVSEGPVDVYLHGADEPPTIPGSLDRTPHQVRVIDGHNVDPDDPSLLARPLQYEAFVNILAAVEQRMLGPAPAVAPVVIVAPVTAPARALPSSPAAHPTAPALPTGLTQDDLRFRLRRWPGAGLLDSIHQGLRMASFITVRYLTVDELSQLSGVDRDGCSSFLNTMMDAELLRAEPAVGASLPAASRAVPAATAARPDRKLLTSLRTKLGIRTEGR